MNRVTDTESGAPASRPRDTSAQRILSMTPDGQTAGSIALTVRHRLESLAQAIRDKDLERLMSFYAHDVEVFDLRFSLNVPGAAAYRNNVEHWFESVEGPLKYEIHGLRVVPGEFSSFCHYLALVVAARADGSKTGYWVRVTSCFERRDGEWLVTHEHVSMPAS
jgi:ketosteroid isomerase-like protein